MSSSQTEDYLSIIKYRIGSVPALSHTVHQLNVTILSSKSPLAFSIGTGEIFLSVGIIDSLQNEAELAFVISHELGHDLLGHRGANKDFSTKELEADLFALDVIGAAGYPRSASISALVNTHGSNSFLDAENVRSSLEVDQFEHPSLKSRLQNLNRQILSGARSEDQNYLISNRNFMAFKRSLL